MAWAWAGDRRGSRTWLRWPPLRTKERVEGKVKRGWEETGLEMERDRGMGMGRGEGPASHMIQQQDLVT